MKVLILGKKIINPAAISFSLDMFPGYLRVEDYNIEFPVEDDSQDEILSDEQLKVTDEEFFFQECRRVLVRDGRLELNIDVKNLRIVYQLFGKPEYKDGVLTIENRNQNSVQSPEKSRGGIQ